ncbi:hypothetical protein Tco_1037926 [Tanacetum coccineum]
MKQDKAQQAARDEKLVPSDDRVKTGKSNLRMDPSILDICPRVQNQEFIVPPSSDSILEFLLDLGYKGQLRHISKIVGILWGIYHKANVDYAALMWKYLQYQFHNRRQGLPYQTVDNDGVLDRLKFINKGYIYQVYGKSIPDTLITNDIKNFEAYKIFFGISTCLIPPKKGRGKGAHETKATDVPKKTIATSMKKHKGAGLKPEVLDELTGKSTDSDEGVGISPEVPDESEDKSKAKDDLDDWGSTNDEEYLLAYKDEKLKDIPWQSTNDDESKNDDEEDDKSIDIEKTDDETTNTDVEDQDDEELKADEEQKGDDQAGDEQLVIPISTTQKEMPSLLQSTSSHFVSSNFGNQFINSPNASFISTIPENAEVEINSLLDIQINQDVPNIQFIKLEKAVEELKQANHSTIILALIRSQVPSVVKEYLRSSLSDAFQKVLRSHTEEFKKELSEKRDYKDVIEESVQANVINKVKNFQPKFLP